MDGFRLSPRDTLHFVIKIATPIANIQCVYVGPKFSPFNLNFPTFAYSGRISVCLTHMRTKILVNASERERKRAE